jgi:hypothetical protein
MTSRALHYPIQHEGKARRLLHFASNKHFPGLMVVPKYSPCASNYPSLNSRFCTCCLRIQQQGTLRALSPQQPLQCQDIWFLSRRSLFVIPAANHSRCQVQSKPTDPPLCKWQPAFNWSMRVESFCLTPIWCVCDLWWFELEIYW